VTKTSGVAGAAYKTGATSFLTHSYETETGLPLCRRVKADHLLCDPYETEEDSAPTCPVCLKRDQRFT
jgi:hypothetical protein